MERSLFATLHVEEESTQNVTIEWKLHPDLQRYGFPIFVVEDLTNDIKEEFVGPNARPSKIQELRLPFVFMPGDRYKVTCRVMRQRYSSGLERWFLGVEEVGRIVKTFTKKHDEYALLKMSYKATEFMMSKSQHNLSGDVAYFIRTAHRQYFEDVYKNYDGMMSPERRESHGNRGCPINDGGLPGLFFTANNFAGGKPMNRTDAKLYIPAPVMLNDHANLYFADFYTADIVPYVTLVLTTKDSRADEFAGKHLCPLDPEDNPYLVARVKDGKTRILVTENILVFLYYTEPVNLHNVSAYGGSLTERYQ